jgi:HAD superfamily phosphatase
MTAIVLFDIDGVIRDVEQSYLRALADTVEEWTDQNYRPTPVEIDALKAEGLWNNDWEAARELIYRYSEAQGIPRSQLDLDYDALVEFFQALYLGSAGEIGWTGYIAQEPLLVRPPYFDALTQAGLMWGFFSGASQASARYVLETRLQLNAPILVAMEDAPGKPDPTGLYLAVEQLRQIHSMPSDSPIVYLGDTVADLYTVRAAQEHYPQHRWLGIGVLPPHVQREPTQQEEYITTLKTAGAIAVLSSVEQATPNYLQKLLVGEP